MSDSTCVVLSAFAGLLVSTGYNVVGYASHAAQARGTELSSACSAGLSAANVVLSLLGIGLFVVASKFGPVSVAMPVQTAASLLLNMLIQASTGMRFYTKSMRVGTLVLAAAAVCLMDVGPTDPKGKIDVLELVSQGVALVWLASMLAVLLASAAAMRLGAQSSSYLGMLVLAVLVADSTALGATVGKMIVATSGFAQLCCIAGWMLMGLGSLGGGLAAAHSCDMSVYLPTTQVIQLLINGLTGLFVWGDGPRVQKPVAYAMVYFLVLAGVYLCSELDILEQLQRRRRPAGGELLGVPLGAAAAALEARRIEGATPPCDSLSRNSAAGV